MYGKGWPPPPETGANGAADGGWDARTADGHPRLQAIDPSAGRKRRRRRRGLALGLGAAFVAGSIAALFGDGGLSDVHRLRGEADRLAAEIDRRRAAIVALETAIDSLQHDPAARERIARERLNLVLPGEVDFLLPLPPPEAPAPQQPTP